MAFDYNLQELSRFGDHDFFMDSYSYISRHTIAAGETYVCSVPFYDLAVTCYGTRGEPAKVYSFASKNDKVRALLNSSELTDEIRREIRMGVNRFDFIYALDDKRLFLYEVHIAEDLREPSILDMERNVY